MRFSVELQESIGFPAGWTALGVLLLLVPIALWLICLLRRPRKEPKREEFTPEPEHPSRRIERARGKYLNALLITERKHRAGKLSRRDAFLELSAIARGFVYECTETDVRAKTLSELEEMNLGYLAALVSEYYEPEFALRSEADFAKSCADTRRMIQTWRG